MSPINTNKLVFILALLFLGFNSSAQKGALALRLGIGLESIPRFEVGQTEYSIDGPAANIGVDYGITKRISVGLHHNFSTNLEGDSQDIVSGFNTQFF